MSYGHLSNVASTKHRDPLIYLLIHWLLKKNCGSEIRFEKYHYSFETSFNMLQFRPTFCNLTQHFASLFTIYVPYFKMFTSSYSISRFCTFVFKPFIDPSVVTTMKYYNINVCIITIHISIQ